MVGGVRLVEAAEGMGIGVLFSIVYVWGEARCGGIGARRERDDSIKFDKIWLFSGLSRPAAL
jgi:hypothetical protein